jgi:hypothetical protein
MAMRLSGTNCWTTVSCTKEDQDYTTHVCCLSRLRGLKCPLEGRPGVRPFEFGPECFKTVKGYKKKIE